MSLTLIDPFLLYRPRVDELSEAVASLVAWTSPTSTTEYWCSEKCLGPLISAPDFPYLNVSMLRALFQMGGESLPVDTLCSLVGRWLNELKYLESECGELLCENMNITPNSMLSRVQTSFHQDQSEAIAITALVSDDQTVTLASRAGGGVGDELSGTLTATVIDCDPPSLMAGNSQIQLMASVKLRFAPVLAAFTPDELLVDSLQALTRAYLALIPDCDKELYPIRQFTVGSNFQASLVRLNGDPSLLGTLALRAARILSGQEGRFPALQIHPHLAGNGKQMTRSDGYSAFRAQLTEHNAGYRLLYWKRGPEYELWEVRTEGK